MHVNFLACCLADSWYPSNDCCCQDVLKCKSGLGLQVGPVHNSGWEEVSMSQAGGSGLEGPF